MKKEEWDKLPPEERTCESCDYPAECTEFSDGWPREYKMLCEICSNTHLSKPVWYPNLFTDSEKALFQSIAWIANKIIARKELP